MYFQNILLQEAHLSVKDLTDTEIFKKFKKFIESEGTTISSVEEHRANNSSFAVKLEGTVSRGDVLKKFAKSISEVSFDAKHAISSEGSITFKENNKNFRIALKGNKTASPFLNALVTEITPVILTYYWKKGENSFKKDVENIIEYYEKFLGDLQGGKVSKYFILDADKPKIIKNLSKIIGTYGDIKVKKFKAGFEFFNHIRKTFDKKEIKGLCLGNAKKPEHVHKNSKGDIFLMLSDGTVTPISLKEGTKAAKVYLHNSSVLAFFKSITKDDREYNELVLDKIKDIKDIEGDNLVRAILQLEANEIQKLIGRCTLNKVLRQNLFEYIEKQVLDRNHNDKVNKLLVWKSNGEEIFVVGEYAKAYEIIEAGDEKDLKITSEYKENEGGSKTQYIDIIINNTKINSKIVLAFEVRTKFGTKQFLNSPTKSASFLSNEIIINFKD